jgi:anti-repressor protein
MNALQIFNYQEKQIRTVLKDGEPWFVAKDVCEILELGDTSKAVSRLSDSMKGTNSIPTPGGYQEVLIVSEAGVYKLVFTSRKPEAEKFTDWLAVEVIPQIRKTGSYLPAQIDSKFLYQIAAQLEEKEKQIQLMTPKAEFFDAVANSKTAIPMAHVAKVLGIRGLGRNNLFQLLREKKVLMKDNTPYQEFVDRGYFRTIEQKYQKPDGETCISIKTLVYQRGLDFIRRIVQDRSA